jgi:hypothetical protein
MRVGAAMLSFVLGAAGSAAGQSSTPAPGPPGKALLVVGTIPVGTDWCLK